MFGPNEPADAAMLPGVVKMPEPITQPTSTQTDENNPISRFNSVFFSLMMSFLLTKTMY